MTIYFTLDFMWCGRRDFNTDLLVNFFHIIRCVLTSFNLVVDTSPV